MDLLSSEELCQLTYTELKKYAKKQGIKKTNMKAEKLISAILSANSKDEAHESFTTCNESLDNSLFDQSNVSCEVSNVEDKFSSLRPRRKTQVFSAEKTPKENKSWSEDSEIELKIPTSILKRSSTFSVETPVTPVEKQPKLNCKVADLSTPEQYFPKQRVSSVKVVSIGPVEKSNPPDKKERTTISQDETSPATTSRKSILRLGEKNLPVKRAKSSGNKVNFITPDRKLLRKSISNSETPLKSVKNRPKTPVAVRNSVKRKRIPSPFPEKSPKHAKSVTGETTPMVSRTITGGTTIKLDIGLQAGTPMAKSVERKPVASTSKLRSTNFKEIHQKTFEKMENVEEYHKRINKRWETLTRSQKRSRKEVSSSVKGSAQKNNSEVKILNSKTELESLKPTRIPQPFRGIPFIPTVKSIRKINTNFTGQASSQSLVSSTCKRYIGTENDNPNRRCQRSLFSPGSSHTVFQFGSNQLQENSSVAAKKHSRKRFDLKASLAKKLPYRPHRGILKPLSDSNANQIQLNVSCPDPIKKKREESREILKGVRRNRRFELQMSHRGIS